MPGIHIGESFHGTSHSTGEWTQAHRESGPDAIRVGSSDAAGAARPATAPVSAADSSPTQHVGRRFVGPAREPVLRLRGGGNAHPSGEKSEDRARLMRDEAGGSREPSYHGTVSRSEAKRAENDAKRYDLQSRLDRAIQAGDGARRARENAITKLERISAAKKAFEDEKRSGADAARRNDIDSQLRMLEADQGGAIREVADSTDAMRTFDDDRRKIQRELDKLRWT